MLRARFSKAIGGNWQQYIAESTDASFAVQHVEPRDSGEISQAILQSRSSLDIESGPVMAAVLCDVGQRQSLFVAVHHLVVDLVSWRVLLEELEDLLLGRPLFPASSMPFQTWSAIQAEHAARDVDRRSAIAKKVYLGQLSYWGVTTSGDISHTPTTTERFILNIETTSALLGSCNDAFRTRPVELMIAGLIYSFAAVFRDRSPAPIFNETHGREPWDDSIDLTRTVGWFTSLFPVQISTSERSSLLDVIRATKDCMRSFKDNGRSYFASRFINGDSTHNFASVFPVEMVFNYQGVYQQLERDESLFKNVPVPDGCNPASAAEAAKFSLFTISVVIDNGCAHVSVAHSGITKHQAEIPDWVQQYESALMDMPNLLQYESPESTLSDSDTDLECFRSPIHCAESAAYSLLPPGMKEAVFSGSNSLIPGMKPHNIADILPVTYAQQNYITQGAERPPLAFNYLHVDIGPQLDQGLLKDSCHKLVNHFPILRTQFGHFQGKWWQIVLLDVEFAFSTFEVNGSLSEESDAICVRDSEQADPLGLPTSFMLVRSRSEGNRLIVRLSHAQYDGVCLPFILRTLVSIYQQEPLLPAIGFSTYLAHARNEQTESARYWRELLQGSQLSRAIAKLKPEAPEEVFPRAVLVERDIYAPTLPDHLTMASVVSSAWAVVLSRISGEEDIVYGQVVAGRNSDIPGIAEIVGPCINIVPVRAFTSPSKISEDLIFDIQEQYISLGQADSMGWDEIIQQCTDWTSGLALDTVVLHQNIDVEPEIHIAGATGKAQWFSHPLQVAHHIAVVSQPQGDKLRIIIAGNSHILRAEIAGPLLDMLIETIIMLSINLQAPLASCESSLPAFTLSNGS
ncbi:hypothetical protein V502_04376 [Pseudogymnoascus sp. VKM F-4520 (FW-2644)]|nr:hypothetical protein V502_04376 [Pseudogymnoascus sp. VKM F-4520 (FW-2644)]